MSDEEIRLQLVKACAEMLAEFGLLCAITQQERYACPVSMAQTAQKLGIHRAIAFVHIGEETLEIRVI